MTTIYVYERPVSAGERLGGWSYAYEMTPRLMGRTLTVEPLPHDLMQNKAFATVARLSGATFAWLNDSR